LSEGKVNPVFFNFNHSFKALYPQGAEVEEKSGLTFNIQRFSLHDGPGIRTTVFLKGCPLACKWCSNPESWNPYPEIITFDIRCIRCGRCVEACPQGAITIINEKREIDWSKCNQCLKCAEVCPSGAIEQVGKYMSVDEVVEEVGKDALFYLNSGGGVTFSGGEPLTQWEFVKEACQRCKEKGIHTALDTTGCVGWDIMEQVLEYIDLVLYDIKHTNPLKHIEGTGVSNELILANLEKTAAKTKTWLRVALIPAFNVSESFIEKVAQLARQLKVEKVSLLPYHEWGKSKYARLGQTYPFEGVDILSDDCVNEYKGLIQSCGVQVDVGS